jgi:3-oxoacyl-[acyl-carrier protein] reductase
VNDLHGKRALITGGSRGIGAATTRLFAELGVDVAIGYRNRKDDADRMAAEAIALGVRAFSYSFDIATREGADRLVEAATRDLGGLDVFVGNAGIWPVKDVAVADMDDRRWRTTMSENIDAMFFTSRAAARAMIDGGRIVLVASTAGQRGEAMHADYAASKGAMISFVKSLCIELAPRGITVNSVAPGWVDTEMCAEPFADGGRARIARGIPIGRIATTRDIAGPIVFLCSALARHITGEIINVNGGSVLAG